MDNPTVEIQLLEQQIAASADEAEKERLARRLDNARRRETIHILQNQLCEAQDRMDEAFLALIELPWGKEYADCQRWLDEALRLSRLFLKPEFRAFNAAHSDGKRLAREIRRAAAGMRGYRVNTSFGIPTWDELQPEPAAAPA